MADKHTPAFPFQSVTVNGEPNSPNEGMSLRDYFAGQALVGKLQPDEGESRITIARCAYKMADAMIAARGEGGE